MGGGADPVRQPLRDKTLFWPRQRNPPAELAGGWGGTFPLKYPVAKLVTGDLRHSNLLILPARRSNFAIDFAVACHEEVVDERGNVVVDENGEAKSRRVIVFVQCKDWFFAHPAPRLARAPPGTLAKGNSPFPPPQRSPRLARRA